MCVERANHFTLLEDAMTVGTPLAAAMLQLVTGCRVGVHREATSRPRERSLIIGYAPAGSWCHDLAGGRPGQDMPPAGVKALHMFQVSCSFFFRV
jgi:hypothetical protein